MQRNRTRLLTSANGSGCHSAKVPVALPRCLAIALQRIREHVRGPVSSFIEDSLDYA